MEDFKQLDLDSLNSQEFKSLLNLKNNELKLRNVNRFLRRSLGFALGFGFSACVLFGVPVGILAFLLLQVFNVVPCIMRRKLKKVVEQGQNLVKELSFDIAVLESGCLSDSFNNANIQDMRKDIINHDAKVVGNVREINAIEKVAVVDGRSAVSYPIVNGGISFIKDGAIGVFPVSPSKGVVEGKAGFVSEIYRISYKDGKPAYFAALREYVLRTKQSNGQLMIGIGAKKPIYLYLGSEDKIHFSDNVVIAIREFDASKERKAEMRRNALSVLRRGKKAPKRRVRSR